MDYVLKRWQTAEAVVPVTDDLRRTLRAHINRTGVGAVALLRDAADKPDGLTWATVENWIRGKVKTARQDYLGYVLERWQCLPDKPPANPELVRRALKKVPDQEKHPVIQSGYRLEELPNNIRTIREARGMAKEALAEACGVGRGTVNGWETKQGPFKPATAEKIVKALGCSPSALFK